MTAVKPVVGAFAAVAMTLCSQPAAPIINGTPDAGHECVGSIHSTTIGFLCTGTLIHESWVLTSASCAELGPGLFAMGADYAVSPRVYAVDYAVPHPSYDGNLYDFALLHLPVPATGEPTCAPSPVPDNVTGAMPIRAVGYGLTSYPSGATTARHRADNTISTFDGLQFFYEFSTSGPCAGDQGGPSLNTSTVVIGVISNMDETCSSFGVSNRVSVVHDSFILPTIANPPGIFFDGFESGDVSAW